jgi:hypothetical protein
MGVLRAALPLSTPPLSPFAHREGSYEASLSSYPSLDKPAIYGIIRL